VVNRTGGEGRLPPPCGPSITRPVRAPRAPPSRSADPRLLGREVDPAARPRPERLLHRDQAEKGATRPDPCHIGSIRGVTHLPGTNRVNIPDSSPISPRRPPGDWPPRWLAVLPVRMIRPEATVPTQSPALPGLHVFSPSTTSASPLPQPRQETRWGVNGDSDPSGSARQQKTSRRSTGSPRAGSEGEGSLATRRSARADERRPAAAPAERSKTRRTNEQTAPNPGTSWRGALGEDGRPDERSDGERSDRERPVSAVDDRE
jgi:hypothetical protein